VFIIPYVRAVSYTEGRNWKGCKIGHVVIVVHFMYALPVIKLRSRECRIWVDSGCIGRRESLNLSLKLIIVN